MKILEKIKNSTVIKIILGGLVIIIALFMILVGGIIYTVKYKIHDIDSKLSPDGTYELILQQVGDPDWPFGSTHARVILKNGNNIITKYKFDVHNDGGNISKGSWSVDWNEDSVECVLYGEEQSDQLYRIFFDGSNTESRSLDTHYGANYEYQATKPEEEANPVDEDGYPLDEDWQSYKNELLKIADTIETNDDFDARCNISAKGYPYAVIKREIDETTGEKVEQHLVYNESYYDESKHEYVLEEYNYNSDGIEKGTATIIDFYFIDCKTLEVTDEHINTWH